MLSAAHSHLIGGMPFSTFIEMCARMNIYIQCQSEWESAREWDVIDKSWIIFDGSYELSILMIRFIGNIVYV